MLNALNELPKPLIGRVHGNAFGGGIGMMSVCDVAIGVHGATFGLTETKLGLIPATIGPYVLARMGEDKARRVFMSSRLFDAAEAERLNLLAGVVDPEDLDAAVEDEVLPYLQTPQGRRRGQAAGPRPGPADRRRGDRPQHRRPDGGVGRRRGPRGDRRLLLQAQAALARLTRGRPVPRA